MLLLLLLLLLLPLPLQLLHFDISPIGRRTLENGEILGGSRLQRWFPQRLPNPNTPRKCSTGVWHSCSRALKWLERPLAEG